MSEQGLRQFKFMEANQLTHKGLNTELKSRGFTKYSGLSKLEKVKLLSGQEPPEGFKVAELSPGTKRYNDFRKAKIAEWKCSAAQANRRIKEEGLWVKAKEQQEQEQQTAEPST